jgi:hypothetical protein
MIDSYLFCKKDTQEYKGKHYPVWHGSPFDRGSADSYYSRPRTPHYWPEGTYKGKEVPKEKMTPAEIKAYNAGYDFNEELGDKKEY